MTQDALLMRNDFISKRGRGRASYPTFPHFSPEFQSSPLGLSKRNTSKMQKNPQFSSYQHESHCEKDAHFSHLQIHLPGRRPSRYTPFLCSKQRLYNRAHEKKKNHFSFSFVGKVKEQNSLNPHFRHQTARRNHVQETTEENQQQQQ